jgi:hypothetical protein
MSYRTRPAGYEPAPSQLPSAPRIMTALLLAFIVFSLLIILAGRVPFVPTPAAIEGNTYQQYLARDRELLGSYGNTAEGGVHIPIDRAMQLVVQRGLPVRANPSQTP